MTNNVAERLQFKRYLEQVRRGSILHGGKGPSRKNLTFELLKQGSLMSHFSNISNQVASGQKMRTLNV